jgi:hypothetical protein
MSDNEREKKMIEAGVIAQGLSVKEWRDDPEEGIVGVIGRFRAIEDDDQEGIYVDDEGDLEASVVGAQQYNNERVAFVFKADGMDGAEVRNLGALVDL